MAMKIHMRLGHLTVMNIKIMVIWDGMSCICIYLFVVHLATLSARLLNDILN